MFRTLFVCWLCLLLPYGVSGQRCGVTDTILIGRQGSFAETINIEGYLNNNLADPAQGLCEVSLYFQHSYVYDFVATLTSPSGQSVDLIGPVNNQSRPATTAARWFIDFQRCDSLAAPDGMAQPAWDNNDFWNWPAFGLFRGDYFPNRGCLEDFNTGPVNGAWTFSYTTSRSGEQGQMTYLLLTFCDDRHADGPCCFADAGTLRTDPEIVTCAEPATLPLDYPPRYRQPRPDPAQYDYTYLIARNDSLLFAQSAVDLAGFPAGAYEICGLSYRRGELGQLPLDGRYSPAGLRDELAAVTPPLCASLTPVCQQVRLVPRPDTTFLTRTICTGDAVRIGEQQYDTTNVYTTVLEGFADCDSVVVLDLQVVDALRVTEDTTLCAEAVYVQGSKVYDQPGTYLDTLVSSFGCDSIVTLQLTFAPPISSDTVLSLCAGDTLWVGNEPFFTNTVTSRILTAANGCDSTVNIDLRILEPQIRFGPFHETLTCDLPNTFLNAGNSDFAFLQDVRWLDTLGNVLRTDFGLTADTAGTYVFQLTVGNRGTSCVVRDSIVLADHRFAVRLGLDLQTADAQAGSQVPCTDADAPCRVLNCRNPAVVARLTSAPTGPAYTYRWAIPANGSALGPTDGPELRIDGGGRYGVTVTDPATGCRQDTFLTVRVDTLAPRPTLTGNELLNCARSSITLRADTLQPAADDLDFVWTGACLAAPVTGPALRLDCPGVVTLTVTNRRNFCQRDTTVMVRQNLAPVGFSLAPATAPLNCYQPLQTLTPTATTDLATTLFAWSRNGQPDTLGTDFTLEIAAPGRYQLIGVDSLSACADTATVIVPGDTLRPRAFSGPPLLTLDCRQPTALLGDPAAVDSLQYAWTLRAAPQDTLARLPSLRVDREGSYELTAFNPANGCRNLATTSVAVDLDTPRVRLAFPLDFDCFVDSVVVDASSTFRGFPNEQRWTGPCLPAHIDTNRLAAFCPGTYTYTVVNTDNGCAASDSVEVLLADNSVVAILTDTVRLDCDSGQGRLDRRQGTDAPVVRWLRDGQPIALSGQQPFVTIPGTYSLILGNFNESCRDTAQTVVVADCPVFPVIVPPDSLTCVNTSVVLDARPSVPARGTGAVSEWIIPPGAVTLPGPAERQLTVLSPGTYGFALENTVSGDRDTFFVVVKQNIREPVAEAGPRDTITCFDPLATLDGSGSSQGPLLDYYWIDLDGDTLGRTPSITTAERGTYLLRVQHRFTGCADVDNVLILADVATPELSFTSGNIPCDTVDFAVAVLPDEEGAYAYQWAGPQVLGPADGDTVRIGEPGDYEVVVTNLRNGCPVSEVLPARQLPCPPFPSLPDTALNCRADTLRIAPAFREPCPDCQYRWERNGNRINGQTDSTLAVVFTGNYRLFVTNAFGLVGEATMRVTNDRIVPEQNAGADAVLSCTTTAVTLGNRSAEPDFPFAYQWLDASGFPLSGATADTLTVNVGGAFQLRTTNLRSACSIVDTVVVRYDTLSPRSVAGPGRLLDCTNKRRVLDGINSSLGDRFRYRWRSPFGDLCMEGETTLNPIVRCGGAYTLRVTDIVNGCTAESGLVVTVDDELPNVIPLPDTVLNCAAEEIELVGREITGQHRTFIWERIEREEAVVVPAVAPGVIRIAAPGTYRFTARDTLTGCSNDFSVAVAEDINRPLAEAGVADTFFCALDSLSLTGQASFSADRELRFAWTSRTGFQINRANSLQPVIFQPDRYYLTVVDPQNACTSVDSVTIFRDVEAPVAQAGPDTRLTCTQREIRLGGSGQTLSGQASYQWTTRDGRILIGGRTPSPLIDRPGQYQINVTDPVNDCRGADVVVVREDTLRPRARITLPVGQTRLNCFRPEIALDARTSETSRAGATYRWSNAGRSLGEAPQQTVDRGGRYVLRVTDERNGCVDTDTLVLAEDFVPPTNRIVLPPPLTCARDSALLFPEVLPEVGVYTFRWLAAAGGIIGNDRQQVVRDTGRYLLETFDTRNGCRDTSAITVLADREFPQVTLTPPAALNCERIIAEIDGRASDQGALFVPRWESPGNTAQVTTDPYVLAARTPGVHYLTVSNRRNGCETRDSVVLTRSAVAIQALDVAVTQPACARDLTGALAIREVLGGAGPFRYRLNGGLLTSRTVYDGLPLGTYDLEVVGSDGCTTATTAVLLPGPEEQVTLRPDTTLRLGDSVLLTFRTEFPVWDTLIWTSSGPLPTVVGDSALWVRPLSSQTYRLQIQAGEGCFATDAVVIEVDETVDTYVPTAFSPNGDAVNDRLRPFVGPQVAEVLAFRIYTRWGNLVYDLAKDPARTTEEQGWDGRVDGRLLNSQPFAWELAIRLLDGSVLRRTGEVLLIR